MSSDPILEFLSRNGLPLPVGDATAPQDRNEVRLATYDGKYTFSLQRDVAMACSPLLSATLADEDSPSDDNDSVGQLLSSTPSANAGALSVVVSWLHSSSSRSTIDFPKHTLSANPGTTKGAGRTAMEQVMGDMWVQTVLAKLCPVVTETVSLPTEEVLHALPQGMRRGRPRCEVDAVVAISGLSLLQSVAHVAVFLQFRDLAALLVGYQAKWIQEAAQDERAFGILHRLQPQPRSIHLHPMEAFIQRSLRTPPTGWDASLSHDPSWSVSQSRPTSTQEAFAWLSQTCSNMCT